MAHEIDIHLDPEEAAHIVAADPAEPVVPVVGPEEANLGRDRAQERGHVAGVRRAEALTKKAADDSGLRTHKDKTPTVGVTRQVTMLVKEGGVVVGRRVDVVAAQVPVGRRRPIPSYGSFDAEVVGWRQIVEGVQDEDRDTAEESETETYDPEGIVVTPEAFVPVDDLLNVAGTDLSPLHGVNAAIFAGHEELDERFMSQAEREEERARTIDEYTDYAATAEDLRQ